MQTEVPHFIQGKRVSRPGRALDIYQPATGAKSGYLHAASQETVDQAVKAASDAFVSWSETPPSKRANLLFRYKSLLEQERTQLAQLITAEHGKTLPEAIGSLQRGIDVLEFACGIPSHLQGRYTDEAASGIDVYSLYQPLGVCAGITPFNFPGMIPLWMFPLAAACGNTFILKPSEKDPSCALRLAELTKEAGFPDGVVNVVQGDKETVDALLAHPSIKAVSFVGSSPVAEHVYKTAIGYNKRAQAFGGAKNHCLVMPDADLDKTADAIVAAAYGSTGERCMAISVVLVLGDALADKLIDKLIPAIREIKIGAGTDAQTEMGPLITKAHWERVKSYVDIGKQEGAKLLLDGSGYSSDTYPDGFFMGPSLFDHVQPSMRIYREEIFGPVLCVMRVEGIDQALQLINEHEYGNGVAIFTRDGRAARHFAKKVQAGMVGVNVPVPVPVAYHSFGGWKQSIFSDVGMFGEEAVRFYTKLKTVTQRWF